MSSRKYYGTEHVFTSKKGDSEAIVIKPGQNESLNLENIGIYSSVNGAFKYNYYQKTTSQSITGGVNTKVLFEDTKFNGIRGDITATGTNTYTCNKDMVLYISYSLRYLGGTTGSGFGWIETTENTDRYAQSGDGGATVIINRCLLGSTVLKVSSGVSFSIWSTTASTQIMGGGGTSFQNCTLMIYSLN